MKYSRRDFVATGAAGFAGLCAGSCLAGREPGRSPQADEDGYKLWLRYAPPGDLARQYRRLIRQIRVDGSSATCGIIRDELSSATGAMLGRPVPANERSLQGGTIIAGTPTNSALVRDLHWAA